MPPPNGNFYILKNVKKNMKGLCFVTVEGKKENCLTSSRLFQEKVCSSKGYMTENNIWYNCITSSGLSV